MSYVIVNRFESLKIEDSLFVCVLQILQMRGSEDAGEDECECILPEEKKRGRPRKK